MALRHRLLLCEVIPQALIFISEFTYELFPLLLDLLDSLILVL